MSTNRISRMLNDRNPAPEFQPTGFVPSPVLVAAGLPLTVSPWHQQLYQWAFEQAQAVVRPSWLERDPLGVWN